MENCPQHQQLATDVAIIMNDTKDLKDMTLEVLKSVKGNGGPGLLTQAALNRESIKRAWWWLGGISLSLVGLFVWALKKI